MPDDERRGFFEDMGCKLIITPMTRRGMNPVEDLKLIANYRRIIKDVDPDVIFSYTIKPNIYGCMASNALGYKQVCNVTGTGTTFMSESMLAKLSRVLYKLSMKKAYKVYFQNTGDRDYFISHGMIKDNWEMLPGSGVNLEQHKLCPMPDTDELRFIYIGRLMGMKGVEQYLEAARVITEKYPKAKFYAAGFVEEDKYKPMVEEYHEKGIIEYLGFRKDIDDWIEHCHCTVLPSLGGEGVPNVLLESAATGRVCIASRIHGSKEVVEDGVTGYLFTPGNSAELIEKIEKFIALSADERAEMGVRGRAKMEREFDREIVIAKYIQEAEA
jgi:galacturonosyltransferase